MRKLTVLTSILLSISLLSGCAGNDAMLKGKIDGLNDELTQCREEQEAERLKLAGMEASARLLETLLKQRTAVFNDLSERLKDQIAAGNLRIVFRDGLMILEMPNKLLFESGKFQLKPEGKATVTAIAGALKSIENRRFLIAGHTDNVPVKSKNEAMASNWDLSARRGLSVLNAILEGGVSPKMAAMAGFGEHSPVAENDTDEGKAKNRRIEIILLPNLETLLAPVKK